MKTNIDRNGDATSPANLDKCVMTRFFQGDPKTAQDGLNWSQDGPKTAQDEPRRAKMGQDVPKMTQCSSRIDRDGLHYVPNNGQNDPNMGLKWFLDGLMSIWPKMTITAMLLLLLHICVSNEYIYIFNMLRRSSNSSSSSSSSSSSNSSSSSSSSRSSSSRSS